MENWNPLSEIARRYLVSEMSKNLPAIITAKAEHSFRLSAKDINLIWRMLEATINRKPIHLDEESTQHLLDLHRRLSVGK